MERAEFLRTFHKIVTYPSFSLFLQLLTSYFQFLLLSFHKVRPFEILMTWWQCSGGWKCTFYSPLVMKRKFGEDSNDTLNTPEDLSTSTNYICNVQEECIWRGAAVMARCRARLRCPGPWRGTARRRPPSPPPPPPPQTSSASSTPPPPPTTTTTTTSRTGPTSTGGSCAVPARTESWRTGRAGAFCLLKYLFSVQKYLLCWGRVRSRRARARWRSRGRAGAWSGGGSGAGHWAGVSPWHTWDTASSQSGDT